MKNKTILYGGGAILFVALTLALSYNQWKPNPYKNLDEFAQCLTDKGFVMYGTNSCAYCQLEKEKFKKAFQYITYIECDKEPEKCTKAGIEKTPTWILSNGTKLVGVQNLGHLSEVSSCKLEKR